MIRNNLKIAFRNFRRYKSYTAVNIFGLSLGFACALLILAVVRFHLSTDNFHPDRERIYRIVTLWHDETEEYSPAVPQPLGKAFRENFTSAEYTARKVSYRDVLVTVTRDGARRKIMESQGVAFTEPGFFRIFSYPLLEGNPETVLHQPNEALLTQSAARRLFGNEPAIGRTLRVSNQTDFVVKGILKDLPANTDLKQEIFLSYQNLAERNPNLASDDNWGGVYSSAVCFTRLKPGIPVSEVNNQLKKLVAAHYTGNDVNIWEFRLQPLSDIHFNPLFDGYINKNYLWALLAIGALLLVTACINFTNLATAQSATRAREIGVRKVLGGQRRQLFWQFMTETTLVTLFATAIGVGAATLLLPAVNTLLESRIPLSLFEGWQMPLLLLALVLLVIVLSGTYPGIVLSGFKPAGIFASRFPEKKGSFSLRRGLVILQFAISQVLLIGTLVVTGQMRYMQQADLGFDKEALVNIPVPQNSAGSMYKEVLRNRIAAVSGVANVSLNFQPAASDHNNTTDVFFDNRQEREQWSINLKMADERYISTFGLKLLAGRNISSSDSAKEFLVNETFLKKLNLKTPEEALGKALSVNARSYNGVIIGVVRDFHNYSFHTLKDAVCIMQSKDWYGNCSVKLSGKHVNSALAAIEAVWNELYPDELYSYRFQDDILARFYRKDAIMFRLIEVFALVAILISCLGLYSLISFMALRKTREIGIRKVLGASVRGILWIFGREFTLLMLVAFLLAVPAAWWSTDRFLQDYSYRVPVGVAVYLTAICISFLIVVVTVGYRSLKASLVNPVQSLKTE